MQKTHFDFFFYPMIYMQWYSTSCLLGHYARNDMEVSSPNFLTTYSSLIVTHS